MFELSSMFKNKSEQQQEYLKSVIRKINEIRSFPTPYNGYDFFGALSQLQKYRCEVERNPLCTSQCLRELRMAENELRDTMHQIDEAMDRSCARTSYGRCADREREVERILHGHGGLYC